MIAYVSYSMVGLMCKTLLCVIKFCQVCIIDPKFLLGNKKGAFNMLLEWKIFQVYLISYSFFFQGLVFLFGVDVKV